MTELYFLLGHAASDMDFIADALQQLAVKMKDEDGAKWPVAQEQLCATMAAQRNHNASQSKEGALYLDRADIEKYSALARERADKLHRRVQAVGAYLCRTKATRVLS